MLKWSVLVVLVVAPLMSLAQKAPPAGKLIQVINTRHKAAVQLALEQKSDKGDELIVTFPSGKQCVLKVLDIKDQIATVETSECPQETDLMVGQEVEKSLISHSVDLPEKAPTPAEVSPSPAPAPTAQAEADRQLDVTEISFRPKRGETTVTAAAVFAQESMNVNLTTQNLRLYDQEDNANLAVLSIEVGLTDRFSVGVTGQYLVAQSSEVAYGPATTLDGTTVTTNSDGMRDPAIGASYRMLGAADNEMKVDISFSHSPSIIDARDGDLNTDGNAGRGGSQSAVGLLVAGTTDNFEWGVTVSYTLLGDTDTGTADGTNRIHTSGGNSFRIEYASQFVLSEVARLRLGLGFNNYRSTDVTEDASDDVINISSYTLPYAEIGLLGSVGKLGVGLVHKHLIESDANIAVNALSGRVDLSGYETSFVAKVLF